MSVKVWTLYMFVGPKCVYVRDTPCEHTATYLYTQLNSISVNSLV